MNFFNQCSKSFSFLINKYKLKIILDNVERDIYSTRYIETVYLKNKAAGLEITFEKREQGVFVNIYKLVNCEFPKDTFRLRSNRELYNKKGELINGFDVFDLIDLYNPKLDFSPFLYTKENSLKKILDNYAISIDKCAGDVLNGNFSIFFKVKEIVDKRRQEYRRQFK